MELMLRHVTMTSSHLMSLNRSTMLVRTISLAQFVTLHASPLFLPRTSLTTACQISEQSDFFGNCISGHPARQPAGVMIVVGVAGICMWGTSQGHNQMNDDCLLDMGISTQ
jgi:hypothetical protein